MSGKITWHYLKKIDFCLKIFFWLYLPPKLSTFRPKVWYLKKLIFIGCIYYQNFGENYDILIPPWKKPIFVLKNVFWPYLLNYQHFGQKHLIFRSPWTNFCLKNRFLPYLLNKRQEDGFLRSHCPKNRLLAVSLKLSTFRPKGRYFNIPFENLCDFCPKIC